MNYIDFLKGKNKAVAPLGFDVDANDLNPLAKDWQRSVTARMLHIGRGAIFEDCGLGKTLQELMWSEAVAKHTGAPVLIVAPLAVARQTYREGLKFGINTSVCRRQEDMRAGINITNYEMLDHFDASRLGGVVLDESSILKSYMGKTKQLLVEKFRDTPYKLAASATPAPNDLMELLNHAEFLGLMRSSEALSVWFIADQRQSGKYRLKGHAEKDFWRWVASWAVCIEKPSDIGYLDDGYLLPPLDEQDVVIPIDEVPEDFTQGLFRELNLSATGFYQERARTLEKRVEACAEIVGSTDEQYLVWCKTNDEADALKRSIPDAVEVRGSHSAEAKEAAALDFIDGKTRVLISKSSIFGWGLNFQQCRNSVFCGLDYSFEGYYQAVRRLYRFGQDRPVKVYRVLGSTEREILDTINRKQGQKQDMAVSMAAAMKELQTGNIKGHEFRLDTAMQRIEIPEWVRSEAS